MPKFQVLKFKASIEQNNDDGREKNNDTWYSEGNAGNTITFGKLDGVVQHGAFRFRNINIPKEARIVLARLRLKPAVTDSSDPDVKLIIKGIKEADTKPFSQTSRPSLRNKTVNSKAWHIIKKWEVHEWVQTPNLQLIVEEIVAQTDWKPGNAIAFVIEDNGSTDGQVETCWDKNKGEEYRAELEVLFTDPDTEITVGYLGGTDRDGVEISKTTWQKDPDGNVITIGNDGSNPCDGGLIFSGINIPKRAEIVSAKLLLTQADQNNRYPNLLIKGFAQDNAPAFSDDGSNRPSTRPKTTAETQWFIGYAEEGTILGEHWSAESVYESPELKEIAQEIVDRDGWAENNKIGLVIEDWESGSGQYKLFWDYVKNSGEFPALLVIVWRRQRTTQTASKDLAKWEKSNYPEFIIVHHSATDRDTTHFSTIKKNHISYGWGDIGYHKWIAGAADGDGTLIHGRPENTIGAHCTANKMNYRSIGICVCGNFQTQTPTANQLATLETLLDDLCKEKGISHEKVFGHGEVPGSATTCPGQNLLPHVQHYRKTGKLT
jgi:hypothetical protein